MCGTSLSRVCLQFFQNDALNAAPCRRRRRRRRRMRIEGTPSTTRTLLLAT